MLRLRWAHGHKSEYPLSFLEDHAYSHGRAEARSQRLRPPTLQRGEPMPIVEHDAVMHTDEGVLDWCRQLSRYGFCIVNSVPVESGMVKTVASRIAPTQQHIYGDVFDVKSEPNPINIAYSNVGLDPHVDLAYLESPPGLQFLHCLHFDDDVVGGLSTLVDVFEAAERLRSSKPRSFATLCELPNTFQKVHYKRDKPVHIVYQRHHVVVNHLQQVVAVNWSPPFEGPLSLPESDVDRFYEAYHDFADELDGVIRELGIEFRLEPGQMLSFNNRRALHGRTAFESSSNGTRHLQGCYVNIDDFHNRHHTLRETCGDTREVIYRIGNHNMA